MTWGLTPSPVGRAIPYQMLELNGVPVGRIYDDGIAAQIAAALNWADARRPCFTVNDLSNEPAPGHDLTGATRGAYRPDAPCPACLNEFPDARKESEPS